MPPQPRTAREILGDRLAGNVCGMTLADKIPKAEGEELAARYKALVTETLIELGNLLTAKGAAYRDEFNPCNEHLAIFAGTFAAGVLHMTLETLREAPTDVNRPAVELMTNVKRIFAEADKGKPFRYERLRDAHPAAEGRPH